MNRRDTILALVALVATPLATEAQQPARPARIGWVGFGDPESARDLIDSFKQGMRERGYIEGKNVVLEMRWALGKAERLQDVAAEIKGLNPDVIVTGNTQATLAAQRVTKTIPIVAVGVDDPVSSGLVASFARPGGNTTALAQNLTLIAPKHLELVRVMLPTASRVAVLTNPKNPTHGRLLRSLRSAAQKLSVQMLTLEAGAPEDIEGMFGAMTRQRVDAVIVVSDPMFFSQGKQIAEATLRYRVPAIFQQRDYVELGGLVSYGQPFTELWRHAATYVDKILKGAKAGDLPVEQPNTYELVVNLKTANSLGITIPKELLLRANRLIE